jgi:hypothetical protein
MTKNNNIDYTFVASQIPTVMNALYNEKAFESVSLQEIRDAFRVKQMQSKAWLLEQVDRFDRSSKVLVIGSWIGFTSLCLWKMGFTNITECDPDSRLETLACHLNRFNKDFKHFSSDVNSLSMQGYDLIINTSCEHIADNTWYSEIPSTTTVILHSNNLEGYDHVNTKISDGCTVSRRTEFRSVY